MCWNTINSIKIVLKQSEMWAETVLVSVKSFPLLKVIMYSSMETRNLCGKGMDFSVKHHLYNYNIAMVLSYEFF